MHPLSRSRMVGLVRGHALASARRRVACPSSPAAYLPVTFCTECQCRSRTERTPFMCGASVWRAIIVAPARTFVHAAHTFVRAALPRLTECCRWPPTAERFRRVSTWAGRARAERLGSERRGDESRVAARRGRVMVGSHWIVDRLSGAHKIRVVGSPRPDLGCPHA